MGSQGREHVFRCPCFEKHMDYQKIVDLRDAGLVIYRQTTRNEDVKPTNATQFSTSTSEDIFILHNTKDVEILSADIMSSFDEKEISCPRCRHIIENAKNLLKTIPKINRNDIMGICDHCRRKLSHKPCQECDGVVKKFVTSRDDVKDSRRHINMWLSKIHHLLKDVVISEKHAMKQDRCSDINIQNVHQNSPLSSREPEVGHLFHSEDLRAVSTRSLDLSDRSYHSHPNYPKVKKHTKFAEFSEQGPSKIKRFVSRSQQDLSYIGDESFSLLEAVREDFVRKSITDLPLKKGSMIPTGKYKSKEIFKSMSDLSLVKHFKTPHGKYKSENALNSSTGLPLNKLSEMLPQKYKSENALLTSISGFAADDYIIKEGFGYVFLKEEDERKIPIKKRISSSELIKDTQDMLQARAEEEKIRQEDERRRKQEEQEKRRKAREDQRLLREEQKKQKELQLAEEAKRIAEEEQKKLAEEKEKLRLAAENAKKLAEQEEEKSAKEEKKLSRKDKDKKQPKEKPERKQVTETASKIKASPKEKNITPIETKKKDEERHKSMEPSPAKPKEKPPKIVKEEVEKPKKEKPEPPKKEKPEPPKKEKPEPVVKEKDSKNIKEVSDQRKDNIDIKESKEPKEPAKPKVDTAAEDFKKLLEQQAKEKEEMLKEKKRLEEEEKKAREAAEKIAKEHAQIKSPPIKKPQLKPEPEPKPKIEQEKPTEEKLKIKQITVRNPSGDDLILQLVKLKQSTDTKKSKKEMTPFEVARILSLHRGHKNKDINCIACGNSDIELELERIKYQNEHGDKMADIIKGHKICKYKPPLVEKHKEEQVLPILFQSSYHEEANGLDKVDENIIKGVPNEIELPTQKKSLIPKGIKAAEQEVPKGIIRYALSDRSFIDKGWTMLPTEKVVRKMNVYRMRPAQPEFDWFEHNKKKRLMQYDTGEKLAEFDDNGRGRWFYKNGRLALDYYDAEETNAQQRFVVYSSGEPDERGRSRPITVLATFDYLGNGVVFDHSGKIRLKYNQTEGVVLDRAIGPVSHWKWHTLNDPPVLQQVMIDTQMSYKDPVIAKLGGPGDNKARPDNEEMLAIEFDNFIKEKSKKLTQKFKPFQIRMKALKINESFSLKVLDQATVHLIFRDGSANLKLNIGMILDHKEIVDTDTAEVGEVSNSLERLPARTDSIAGMQASVAHAARVERQRLERERRLRPAEPCGSADRLTAAAARPLRPPFRTAPSSTSPTSATTTDYLCRCRKPSSSNLYYDTRLI